MRALPATPELKPTRLRYSSALLTCVLLVPAIAGAATNAVRGCVEALSATLPEPARSTLTRTRGLSRQALALRSYLRAGEDLGSRWSWTEEQIREFEGSPHQQRFLQSLAAVIAQFEVENPGYSLFVNTQVRSLELQLERWSSNPRVGEVADELYSALRRELRQSASTQQPGGIAIERCRAFLVGWRPSRASPLAAPGLSAHGQLRAVDFQVMKGSQIVAGTSISLVARDWVKKGWADRLRRVVSSMGGDFIGPLQSPNEPWHYLYEP
jgi:hypothetical protein